MQHYLVYDGRANFNIDAATVLEVITAGTDKQAIKEFRRDYKDHDAVLVRANQVIDTTLWDSPL